MPIKQRPKILQDIWATFAIKFITDAFQTIAKSGHTGKWRSDRSCKMLIHDLRKLDYFLKLIFCLYLSVDGNLIKALRL